MTKPLPTCSIKGVKKTLCIENLISLFRQFLTKIWSDISLLLTLNLTQEMVAKKLLFNEIYTRIFEKNKVFSSNERSVFQLLDAVRLNNKGWLNSYKATAKTHSTMSKKNFIPLYAEHLHFFLNRCRWVVIRIYAHAHLNRANSKRSLQSWIRFLDKMHKLMWKNFFINSWIIPSFVMIAETIQITALLLPFLMK